MYEEEIAFLAAVEDRTDKTNRRRLLDAAVVERIRETLPGIPEDYLAYLREIGWGTVGKSLYLIIEPPPFLCHEEPLTSWFEADGRNLLVFGDNFFGDLYAFDADHNYRIVELLHEYNEVWPFEGGGFKEFIRRQMGLGSDGTDRRRP